MRKTIALITAFSLLASSSSFAQDDAEDDELVLAPPKKPVASEMQNWLFAGGSVIAAAIGIILVALNPGSSPASGQETLP